MRLVVVLVVAVTVVVVVGCADIVAVVGADVGVGEVSIDRVTVVVPAIGDADEFGTCFGHKIIATPAHRAMTAAMQSEITRTAHPGLPGGGPAGSTR